MKVKIFMEGSPEKIERQINLWFEDGAGTSEIVKTETAIAAVAEREGDGTYPCIVITIWYEPSSN